MVNTQINICQSVEEKAKLEAKGGSDLHHKTKPVAQPK